MITWQIIKDLLIPFRLSYELIIGFLCYSAIKPVWKELPKTAMVVLAPLASYLLVDIVFNWTVGWLVFWQLPQGKMWTFTERLQALLNDVTWRGSIACYICKILNILNPNHCKNQ